MTHPDACAAVQVLVGSFPYLRWLINPVRDTQRCPEIKHQKINKINELTMLCNCFAYQHLLTPVVPAVCFYCGDRLMSYSRLSDLRTPGYYFPSYLPAFLLPRRKLITVSNTQILKNLILPDVCSNLPVSCFLRSHRFNFECFNQLHVSSQKPVRLPRQTHFSYLPPAVIVLWGLPKHTEEECINFITAAQNR